MSLSGLIEQQVLAGPDAIAVHYPGHAGQRGGHLTYRELSRAANRLAAHLQARGIRRGDRVVLSLRPGPELVSALLGAVRAGAAYVPVDPAAPLAHRHLVVRDCAAGVVLTDGAGAGDYAGLGAVVVDLDAEAGEIAGRSAAPADRAGEFGPDEALHVRYSPTPAAPDDGGVAGGCGGAVGVEGVVVSHGAVVDFVRATGELQLGPADAVAQSAGSALDAVVFEVWATLAAGARLVGLGPDTVADAGRFQDAVRALGVSVVFLPAALFDAIARRRPAAFASLRTVLIGGQGVDARRVRQVCAAGAPGRLLHLYGPAGTAPALWREAGGPHPATETATGNGAGSGAGSGAGEGEVGLAGVELDEDMGVAGGCGGLSLPVEEVAEWRAAAVARIGELPRRRVLELGAGGGLLEDLARDGKVEEYWATDPSPAAVAALRARVEAEPVLKGKVRLARRGIEDLGGLPAGHFDTVVVSSVSRHVPDAAGLRRLVEGALGLLAPGGSLFLGDLRNLDLAHCRHTALALARTGGVPGDREALRRDIEVRVAAEREQPLAPAGLVRLAGDLPAVRGLDLRAPRGVEHNELTRYRYDAVLSTAPAVADLAAAPAVRWGQDVDTVAGWQQALRTGRPAVLRLAGVPNRRVHDAYTAMQSLFDPREGIDLAPQDAPAPGLEVLCAAAERLGYRALATWGEVPHLLDVVAVDPARVPAGPVSGLYVPSAAAAGPAPAPVPLSVPAPVPASAPVPVSGAAAGQDGNGAEGGGEGGGGGGGQPGTPVEEIVCDLFAEAVGAARQQVHADCDFFRLGGDARAADRLLERVREMLDVEPGVRALYEHPTPAAFAALVGDRPAARPGPRVPMTEESAQFTLRLRGPLDTGALQAALEDLGRCHAVLRNSRLGFAGTRLQALAAEEHLLHLALPADRVDCWSRLPLAGELARAYTARAGGAGPCRVLPGPDVAPRAHGDAVPATPVPGSAAAPAGGGHGRVETQLDAGLHARLTRLAAARGATVFMVVHAALAALLHQMGAAGTVTVAAPVPARGSAALRRAVGSFGRVLALSVDTGGDPAFGELLRRVRAADLAAYTDARAPLAAPGGGIALSVQREAAGQVGAGGLSIRVEPGTPPLPAADLALTLTERHSVAGAPAGLTLSAAFCHERVGESAAAALAGRLTALLRAAVIAPDTPLSRLRPAPAGAQAGSAGGVWAGTDVPSTGHDVAALVAAQVARAPRAPALAGLDYAELDARSDLLAHALIAQQAGPGRCVLTALSSPTNFAVAALAVAKTGAALLPVDPAHPLAPGPRPAVLLLDETADLLLEAVPGAARLVREDAADRLPPAGHWPLTAADRIRPLRAEDPLLLAPGETGTAAVGGEAVTAAALSAPVDAGWLVRGYPDADTALGLLSTLAAGARIHLPDPRLSADVPHEVLGWLRRRNARMVLGGADDMLCALIALARTDPTPLRVSGGWAEGRLVVDLTPGAPARPAPGHRAYLLDAALRPVAPGHSGALYIAGAGVAQHCRPHDGADRYLPDPFGGPDGGTARMWRTGRAARLDGHGTLRVGDHPAPDDPFTDPAAAFLVLSDPHGRRALWPATAPVPPGWRQEHPATSYDRCLPHLTHQPGHPLDGQAGHRLDDRAGHPLDDRAGHPLDGRAAGDPVDDRAGDAVEDRLGDVGGPS
ncbi:AMP-binding protein [Streptomyces sp. NPDC057616]|uniref:AMP-binding protein n=1 Tax=Streptomyces sp. NPDC057616 TaxID=3346183 RepID=UPI0036ADAB08